jgi:hypothetical protein
MRQRGQRDKELVKAFLSAEKREKDGIVVRYVVLGGFSKDFKQKVVVDET